MSDSDKQQSSIDFVIPSILGAMAGFALGKRGSTKTVNPGAVHDIPAVTPAITFGGEAISIDQEEVSRLMYVVSSIDDFSGFGSHLTPSMQVLDADYYFAFINWLTYTFECGLIRASLEPDVNKRRRILRGACYRLYGGKSRNFLPIDGAIMFTSSSGLGGSSIISTIHSEWPISSVPRRKDIFGTPGRDIVFNIRQRTKLDLRPQFSELLPLGVESVDGVQTWSEEGVLKLQQLLKGEILYSPVLQETASVIGDMLGKCDLRVIYSPNTYLFAYCCEFRDASFTKEQRIESWVDMVSTLI